MFVLDGKQLSPDIPFEHNGVKYPASWLRCSSLEDKEAIGITEVPDPPQYDGRFYFGYDVEGHLIPRDHAQLVTQWVEQTRQTANSLLTPTDWIIIRQADNGIAPDLALRTWREEIRLSCGSKVYEIEHTTTTDQLAAYITGPDYNAWPIDPYAPKPAVAVAADEPTIDVPVEEPVVTTEEVTSAVDQPVE